MNIRKKIIGLFQPAYTPIIFSLLPLLFYFSPVIIQFLFPLSANPPVMAEAGFLAVGFIMLPAYLPLFLFNDFFNGGTVLPAVMAIIFYFCIGLYLAYLQRKYAALRSILISLIIFFVLYYLPEFLMIYWPML